MTEIKANLVIKNDQNPKVNADLDKIKQVFRNLINNSIKYRSERKLNILIDIKTKPNELILKFTDNGLNFWRWIKTLV
jgi:signal transduction histidine kinase